MATSTVNKSKALYYYSDLGQAQKKTEQLQKNLRREKNFSARTATPSFCLEDGSACRPLPRLCHDSADLLPLSRLPPERLFVLPWHLSIWCMGATVNMWP